MHRVLVDEDMPRTLAAFLRSDNIDAVNEAVAHALRNVTETDIVGALLIVEPGRVRMLRRVERA